MTTPDEWSVDKRLERGVPHNPHSQRLVRALAEIDYELGGDRLSIKIGGEGDNGEHLMYLLDIYFEQVPDAFAKQSADIHAALNLLAVLHRDGGHRTGRVGFVQSCKDAEAERHKFMGEMARLTASEKRLAEMVSKLMDRIRELEDTIAAEEE